MPAVYPVSVKTFLPKTDNIDTVWAAHVNDLQNEVTAIEKTVGTNPANWEGFNMPFIANERMPPPELALGRAKKYADIGTRLDALQRQLTWATTLIQLDASDLEPGAIKPQKPTQPKTPVAQIRASGQPVTAGANDWSTFRWTSAVWDPFRMYQGGTRIYCGLTGFWMITAQIKADPGPYRRGDFHFVHTRMLVNGQEIGGQDSLLESEDGIFHRLNITWAGKWSKDQYVEVQVSQHGVTSSSVDASCNIGLIYARDTV
jgi:hypothetical protein